MIDIVIRAIITIAAWILIAAAVILVLMVLYHVPVYQWVPGGFCHCAW